MTYVHHGGPNYQELCIMRKATHLAVCTFCTTVLASDGTTAHSRPCNDEGLQIPDPKCAALEYFFSINEKSAQMRCKHCTLAVVRLSQKKFRPTADRLPGGRGQPKFNQPEMVTNFTYKPSLVRINAHDFEL